MKSSWMVNHLCSHSFPLEITWRAIISHPCIGKIYVSNKVEGWNKPLQQVTQLCPILCNLMDSCPPGSPVHGILQARILEWVANPFSRGSSQPKDQTQVSCIASDSLLPELQGKCHPPDPPPLPSASRSIPKRVKALLVLVLNATTTLHSSGSPPGSRDPRNSFSFVGRLSGGIHSPPKLAAETRLTWLPTSLGLHTPSSGSCILSSCLIFF